MAQSKVREFSHYTNLMFSIVVLSLPEGTYHEDLVFCLSNMVIDHVVPESISEVEYWLRLSDFYHFPGVQAFGSQLRHPAWSRFGNGEAWMFAEHESMRRSCFVFLILMFGIDMCTLEFIHEML